MSVMSFSVGGHFNYILSVAPSGSDQSIMLRETERQRDRTKCVPPLPLIPALLLPSQNVLVICCCFCCLLDYLEILLVLGLETNTDDSRLLMI